MPPKLKINNDKSAFVNEDKKPAISFEDQVKQAEANQMEMNAQAFNIANVIFEVFRDRTLQENKSEITKGLENKAIKDLQQLCARLNNDETQVWGAGFEVTEAILFGLLIKFRDRLNIVEYELKNLQNEFKKTKDQELA